MYFPPMPDGIESGDFLSKLHKPKGPFWKPIFKTWLLAVGWNRQRRKDCRNNTMCQECKRRFDAPMHTANAEGQHHE
jgi:hypothetical protein